ncbi:unnamed protein product [Penicillium salamii]|uniref:Small ribosomal subunit protein mS41 n=1 Tax=Penicillium salamii TaxID=1612424 RepID=A0A9W4JH27_9EURO|nr:unnamed protein product [Penicillium salamii]CAG8055407.1 unnamed protein product [Penicillium salamii]CAG8112720.1 unnamed protein product [Penicillium salamii]CAG8147354.1 unnamed protein product [Penicillium salamii]CAG8231044.1 unnamed protein product [Penicillium salamii]
MSMAMRNSPLGGLSSRLFKTLHVSNQCVRLLHQKAARPVPAPTPFVPDVETFLKLIGREMSKQASKIPTWEDLFNLNSNQLRQAGLEPARQRRYLIRKREKFRNGVYGPGGDLHTVVDGVAQLRVVEVPVSARGLTYEGTQATVQTSSATLAPGMTKALVNLAPDATTYHYNKSASIAKFAGMKIHHGSAPRGPHLQPLKGSNGTAALISVEEGMWEDKRGHKVDGGERRRREVQNKKRLDERKKV